MMQGSQAAECGQVEAERIRQREFVAEMARDATRRAQEAGGALDATLNGRFGGSKPTNEHEHTSLTHADALLVEAIARLDQARLLIMGAGPRGFHISETPEQ